MLTIELSVAEVHHQCNNTPYVGLVRVGEVQDLHSSSYDAKVLSISQDAPVAVIIVITCHTVALRVEHRYKEITQCVETGRGE